MEVKDPLLDAFEINVEASIPRSDQMNYLCDSFRYATNKQVYELSLSRLFI